ncbi:MAG: hypothetical protein IRZ14_05380 [Chloroflexi bacterium]|nr:hypothetical protein [Chloroflexota bacterium]
MNPWLAGDPVRGDLRRAAIHALHVAQETAARVPAYARFLRLAGYDPGRLRGLDDFQRLPLTDHASYLARYPIEQRCREGERPQMHLVMLGPGASLWPRFPDQDRALLQTYVAMLHEHFRVRERWTLLIVNLAAGAWRAGLLGPELAQRLFAEQRICGTVATPGLSVGDTLLVVRQLGHHYDQIILVGYPSLLTELLEAGARHGLDWSALNVGLCIGGEPLAEPQRDRLLDWIGKDPERLEGLFALYGSAEVGGLLGYETPLCLLVRRLCARVPALARSLFGGAALATLVQYDPLDHFLETCQGEIVLTTRGGVPLVRYNTHDRGGLLSFEELVARCRAHGLDLAAELRARGHDPQRVRPLPLLYAHGRPDAVVVRGATVDAEQVRRVLERPSLRLVLSGRFQLGAVENPPGCTVLRIIAELREGMAPREELRRLCQYTVLRELQRLNTEFRAVYTAAAGRLEVELVLAPHGTLRPVGPTAPRTPQAVARLG